MNPTALDILQRYLAGTLDLESAAEDIFKLGEYSMSFQRDATTPLKQQRLEELFGRVLWLTLREHDPASVPGTPFGAGEIRTISNDTFFGGRTDESDDKNGSSPAGSS